MDNERFSITCDISMYRWMIDDEKRQAIASEKKEKSALKDNENLLLTDISQVTRQFQFINN